MRTLVAALALCVLVPFGGRAHAALVAGTSTGTFGGFDPGGSSATASISASGDTVSFGDTPASTISFQGYAGPLGFAGDTDTPFAIGDIFALKNPTTTYPAVGTSVVLTTTLSFTAPVAITRTLSFTFDIGLFPGLVAGTTDADLFGTPDVFPATFDQNGQRYDLALVGFDPDGFENDIALTEGIPFVGQLFAQITLDPAPVPEPATLALLALPLLASLRRYRRSSV